MLAHLLDDRNHRFDLDQSQTRHDFVEQQQCGLMASALASSKSLAIRTAKCVGALIGTVRETYEIELFTGECSRARQLICASPRSEQCAHRNVIKDGQPRKRSCDLKGASDSQSGAAISR